MSEHSKRYEASVQLLEKDRAYEPKEAIAALKKMSHVRFDETVELHIRMGLDPRNAQQQVRGVALLPHGLGKSVRVLVFAQGDAEQSARESGADVVGGDDLIKQIEGGFLDFDVAIATPDMMGKVGKLGRILGRKGLMPNPKAGTVVQPGDLARVIGESRKGRVEFKLDRTAIIHVPVGKLSFEEQKLYENLSSVIEAIVKARPSGAKRQYILSVSLASTMSPGIKLDLRTALALSSE